MVWTYEEPYFASSAQLCPGLMPSTSCVLPQPPCAIILFHLFYLTASYNVLHNFTPTTSTVLLAYSICYLAASCYGLHNFNSVTKLLASLRLLFILSLLCFPLTHLVLCQPVNLSLYCSLCILNSGHIILCVCPNI